MPVGIFDAPDRRKAPFQNRKGVFSAYAHDGNAAAVSGGYGADGIILIKH